MTDPLDRLRSVLDAVPVSGTADAAALSRRATLRRCRQTALTGTALASVVLLVLTGPSQPHRLGVTSPPPASGSTAPSPGGGFSPRPDRSPGDAGPSEDPAPWEDARPSEDPAPSERPATAEPTPEEPPGSTEPSAARPPSDDWVERDPVGPAPYHATWYDEGNTRRACARPSEAPDDDPGRTTCYSSYFDVPFEGRTDLRAGFALCQFSNGGETLHYGGEQEAELTITDTTTDAVVYRWSAHQAYRPVPHERTVAAGDCLRHVWRLELADDSGNPLVSGREYRVTVWSSAVEAAFSEGFTTFVAP